MDTGATIATTALASASGTAIAASSTGMSMSSDDGSGCKVSMLWNWYTIDACFISPTWHITSASAFAGSCVGVVLLVMSLEFLRRISKEYDRFIQRSYIQSQSRPSFPSLSSSSFSRFRSALAKRTSIPVPKTPSAGSDNQKHSEVMSERSINEHNNRRDSGTLKTGGKFRPSITQQALRATLHMLQFTVAYFIMLLVMYYNGYLIMCIIIGAWLGAFAFSWESWNVGADSQEGNRDEATVCCG